MKLRISNSRRHKSQPAEWQASNIEYCTGANIRPYTSTEITASGVCDTQLCLINALKLLGGSFALAAATLCASQQTKAQPSPIAEWEWRAICEGRLLFAHQSLGENLLAGVRTLAAQAQQDLPIHQSRSLALLGITEFVVGQNQTPQSKLDDFGAAVHKTHWQAGDIAMLKLCFVDIDENSDAEAIAQQYFATFQQLRSQYPDVRFVTITVPLTSVQTGPSAWLKHAMGKLPSGYAANRKRLVFNQRLRQTANNQGLLFDLASAEALHTQTYFDGTTLEALNPELSSDGGHLNKKGQQILAVTWLHFIAQLTLHRQESP